MVPRTLTTDELSEAIHVPKQTLAVWRVTGRGPRWIKLPHGRRVLYLESEVLKWLESGARTSTSDPGPQPVAA